MKLVSIIIPTFNRIHTLPRALESIFDQEYENYEIIIVDNNSTDGTFIHCGFRPRFFLWKVLGRTGGWGIIDSARDPVNDGTEKQMGPDDDDAEGSYAVLDVTSTGIKMRNQWGDTNQNYDHLFMAFAEQPVSNPYGGQSNAR